MYLDTDIVLALIKDDDWLKKYVKINEFKDAKTSALTIIEARIVLDREYSRKDAISALSKIKKLNIKILPVNEKIIEKSQVLIEKHPTLSNFDSIHAATSLVFKEKIISTDSIFKEVEGLNTQNPREKTAQEERG